MTQNFYEVNRSFSLSNLFVINPSLPKLSETTGNINGYHSQLKLPINLNTSHFILSPYICPSFPYKAPPYPMTPMVGSNRHLRQQAIYSDLNVFLNPENSGRLDKFLNCYQAFKQQKFGSANPTDMSNPYYKWVVKHRLSTWEIKNNVIDLNYLDNSKDDSNNMPALWCFERMGQSRTVLSDGRIVFIGGEYEDNYDPDFCIYNDVIVVHPNGVVNVYTYPKSVFPPTDFHTATCINDSDNEYIIIIGSLGYPEDRQYSHTPVYKLDTQNFKMEQLATRNSMGWVHKHNAVLKDNRIIVTGGEVIIDDISPSLDNFDTWVLNLKTLIWKNMTLCDQKWQRFYVRRQDGGWLNLREYRQLDDCLQLSQSNKDEKSIDNTELIKKYKQMIEAQIRQPPNIGSYRQLYIPPIEHEKVAVRFDNADAYDTTLLIDGMRVGYKIKNDSCIQVVVEGRLSEDMLELLQQNLRHKLSKLENMACEVISA